MSKYRVVNFAGVPYGTPTDMRDGRLAYIDGHIGLNVAQQKSYALMEQFSKIKLFQGRKEKLFVDTSVVANQLDGLLDQLQALNKQAQSMEGREQQQAILHTEQVIGRVARILNRSNYPTQKQKTLYLDNLQETLNLAAELSAHENSFTKRKIGRSLMWIAAAAAMTAIVSYLVLASVPLAMTVAVCSALLGGLGLYLRKFSEAGDLGEKLSDVVDNVKPFPADSDRSEIFGCSDTVYGGPNDDDFGSNGGRVNDQGQFEWCFDENAAVISGYVETQLPFGSSKNSVDDLSARLTQAMRVGLEERVDAGDNDDELYDQLSGELSCEQLAAISGVAIIPTGNTLQFASMEELMAEGDLDPLGAENPTEALQTAFDKYVTKVESQSTSLMTSITHATNSVCSFFAGFAGSSRQHEDAVQDERYAGDEPCVELERRQEFQFAQ